METGEQTQLSVCRVVCPHGRRPGEQLELRSLADTQVQTDRQVNTQVEVLAQLYAREDQIIMCMLAELYANL